MNKNELIFIGGLDSNKWIDDGKELSRNFKQGYRVYDSNGVATTLTSQSIGGLGGYSGLYLVEEKYIVDDLYANRDPRLYTECPTLRSERFGLKVLEEIIVK